MWRWVLLAIVLLLVLLCRTRVGAEAAFSAGDVRVDLRIGWFRLHLLPAKAPEHSPKPKKVRKAKKAKKAKKVKKLQKPKRPKKRKKEKLEQNAPQEETKRPSFSSEDARDAVRTLLPALKRVLRRTRRGIRISPLHLSVTLGGRTDPAKAAIRYGQVQTAVWMGMPVLEDLVEIQEIHIHTGVDFESTGTSLEGEAGATFRIGTLLAMGCGLLFPALGWLLRVRRRKRNAPEETDEKDKEESAAA